MGLGGLPKGHVSGGRTKRFKMCLKAVLASRVVPPCRPGPRSLRVPVGLGGAARCRRVLVGPVEASNEGAEWPSKCAGRYEGDGVYGSDLFALPVPGHWGNVILAAGGGTVVPLLTSAASAPGWIRRERTSEAAPEAVR